MGPAQTTGTSSISQPRETQGGTQVRSLLPHPRPTPEGSGRETQAVATAPAPAMLAGLAIVTPPVETTRPRVLPPEESPSVIQLIMSHMQLITQVLGLGTGVPLPAGIPLPTLQPVIPPAIASPAPAVVADRHMVVIMEKSQDRPAASAHLASCSPVEV